MIQHGKRERRPEEAAVSGVSLEDMFIFCISFSYIIGVQMGYKAIGVWIAMLLDWLFRTICFVGT